MLKGIDVSEFNVLSKKDIEDVHFMLIRATATYDKGKLFVDSKFENHLSLAKSNGKLYGFYHYPYSLSNDPKEEAGFFVKKIKPYIGSAVLALDWEAENLETDPKWALEWLKEVYQQTGVKPLIYMSASEAKKEKYRKIKESDFGLWVAHWGVKTPTIGLWDFWAFWQYRGSPLDLDYFNGSTEQFMKYAASYKKFETSFELNAGDKVKVKKGARDLNKNVQFHEWVYSDAFDVIEVSGTRVVFGKGKSITGVVNIENLTKIK